MVPAGSHANKRYCSCSVEVSPRVSPLLVSVLFDAQTSGGLLLAVPEHLADRARALLEAGGDGAWIVGEVLPERPDGVLLEIR